MEWRSGGTFDVEWLGKGGVWCGMTPGNVVIEGPDWLEEETYYGGISEVECVEMTVKGSH